MVEPQIVDGAGLEVLDRAACLRLLEAGGIGRIAVAGNPPVIRPVNFVLDGERLVIRTGAGSIWRAASARRPASFEIDGSSNVDHRGWSVVASGRLDTLDTDEATLRLPLRAWAPHGRDRFVTVTIDEIGGRRL